MVPQGPEPAKLSRSRVSRTHPGVQTMSLLKASRIAFALSLGALALAPQVVAQDRPLDVYQARLSERDHFNSQGVRLQTAAGIVRQDRANYFLYHKRDPEDQADGFFASKANRDRLEKLILAGHTTASANAAVINGTPMIRVEVYENYVNIYVM
jgi:hypothetical protein